MRLKVASLGALRAQIPTDSVTRPGTRFHARKPSTENRGPVFRLNSFIGRQQKPSVPRGGMT